jgi:transposase-like protein
LELTGSAWEEEKIVLVSGKISDKDGNFKMLCDSVKVVTPEEMEQWKRIEQTQKSNGDQKKSEPAATSSSEKLIITLPANSDQAILKKISAFFDRCDRGAMKVYLSINNSRLETPYCIKNSGDLSSYLDQHAPGCRVEIL